MMMRIPTAAVLAALVLGGCKGPQDAYHQADVFMVSPYLRDKIEHLITEGFRGEYHVRQNQTLDQLVKIGEPAVPFLIDALGSNDYGVRGWSAKALGRIGDRRATPYMVKLVDDESHWTRLWTCQGLGDMGDPAAGPAVYKLLAKETAPMVRQEAADALARMHYIPAVPREISRMGSPDPIVRQNAEDNLRVLMKEFFIGGNRNYWERRYLEEAEIASIAGPGVYPDITHVAPHMHRNPRDIEISRRDIVNRMRRDRLQDKEFYYYFPDPPRVMIGDVGELRPYSPRLPGINPAEVKDLEDTIGVGAIAPPGSFDDPHLLAPIVP